MTLVVRTCAGWYLWLVGRRGKTLQRCPDVIGGALGYKGFKIFIVSKAAVGLGSFGLLVWSVSCRWVWHVTIRRSGNIWW